MIRKKFFRVTSILALGVLISVAAGSLKSVAAVTSSNGIKTSEKNHKKVSQATTKATFMIEPELPKDNIGGVATGYFNLKLKNDRTVKIRVYNPTNKTISIKIKAVNAVTIDNGQIDYTGSKPIDKKLLKQPGTNLVKTPKIVVLKAKEVAEVPIKIKAPQGGFVGQKAVAINLYANQANQQAAIKNRYVYAVGLILNSRKIQSKQLKKIRVDDIKVRLNQTKQPVISVLTTNLDPVFLLKAKTKIVLRNEKWRFIAYHDQKSGLKVAPNSSFYNDLSLKGYRLVPGLYKMNVTISSSKYTKKIQKYVRITKSEAYFVNSRNNMYLRNRNLLIVTGAIVILITIFMITWRRRRKRRF